MDYDTIVELVKELPPDDKQRLEKFLVSTRTGKHSEKQQKQTHHERVRQALAVVLTTYELDEGDPARTLSDDEAERLLDELHHETAGAEPLSTAVIEDRDRP